MRWMQEAAGPALSSHGILRCAQDDSSWLLLLLVVLLLRLVLFLLQALFLLLARGLAALQVLRAVEVHLALDERRVDARVDGQRMAGPDGEVGVLAGLDRADAVIEAELARRIDRAESQRFLFGQAAVLHGLRGVVIEMPRELVGVGVDGGQHAA